MESIEARLIGSVLSQWREIMQKRFLALCSWDGDRGTDMIFCKQDGMPM
jgi:hypothetical protein